MSGRGQFASAPFTTHAHHKCLNLCAPSLKFGVSSRQRACRCCTCHPQLNSMLMRCAYHMLKSACCEHNRNASASWRSRCGHSAAVYTPPPRPSYVLSSCCINDMCNYMCQRNTCQHVYASQNTMPKHASPRSVPNATLATGLDGSIIGQRVDKLVSIRFASYKDVML